MEFQNSVVTHKARQSLEERWGLPIGAFFVVSFISGVSGAVPFIGFIVAFILGGPLALGACVFSLKFVRNQEVQFEDIFEGFNNFGKALVLYLLQGLYVFLWMLLLIVPGVIAAIGYSQSFFILSENPDMSPSEAIDKSKQMMDGYKMQYFLLGFRFIGWALLCILTVGIGFLWLLPYIRISLAKFYIELKGDEMSDLLEEFHSEEV